MRRERKFKKGGGDVIVVAILYVALGYWATGKTIYANKIIIHQFGQLFMQRMLWGTIAGWILIPVAIVKTVFGR